MKVIVNNAFDSEPISSYKFIQKITFRKKDNFLKSTVWSTNYKKTERDVDDDERQSKSGAKL